MLTPDRVDRLVRDLSATVVLLGVVMIGLGIRRVSPLPWELVAWGYLAPAVILLAAAAYAGWWAGTATSRATRLTGYVAGGGAIALAAGYIVVLALWWIGWSCFAFSPVPDDPALACCP
jgi:hypothetical protein